MSCIEYHFGKLKKVDLGEVWLEIRLREIHGDKPYDDYYDDLTEFYESGGGMESGYIVIHGDLYEIQDKKIENDYGFLEVQKDNDGTINYQVGYYNGGADLTEVLRAVLNKVGE